jgi:hypothetical protein
VRTISEAGRMENVFIKERVLKIAREKAIGTQNLAKVLGISEAVLKRYFGNVENGAVPDALFEQLLDYIDPP